MFSIHSENFPLFLSNLKLLSANSLSLEESKILLFGKELNVSRRLNFEIVLKKKLLENIVGKGENAGDQHFRLFLQCFYPFQQECLFLSYIYFVVGKCFQFGLV